MRTFIFEFTTGGGLAKEGAAVDLTLLVREGVAMVAALAGDFAALPQSEVIILRDRCCALPPLAGVYVREVADESEYRAAFDQEAARADWTIVIAPESSGLLLEHVERVAQCRGRLLGPGPEVVRLAGDKQAMAEHLASAGVPVPADAQQSSDGIFPHEGKSRLIVKPRDGAGSQGIRRLNADMSPNELPCDPLNWRIERFCPGQAASVAMLCGPAGHVPLAPCAQTLSDDGHFRYLGGRLPLAAELAERATRLAQCAVATLPEPLGYLGVDLVLGADASGRDDVVIEINPRLTTSYVGLRAGARQNLAAAMLAVAAGCNPALSFGIEQVEFAADGTVTEMLKAK